MKLNSKVLHVVALVGIAVFAISYFALPWISFGTSLEWTGIGLLGTDGPALHSIGALAFGVLAVLLTVAALRVQHIAVRIGAVAASVALVLVVLALLGEFSQTTSLGDGRQLIAAGLWVAIVGGAVAALGNGASIIVKRG